LIINLKKKERKEIKEKKEKKEIKEIKERKRNIIIKKSHSSRILEYL